jgi:hypothetical protein
VQRVSAMHQKRSAEGDKFDARLRVNHTCPPMRESEARANMHENRGYAEARARIANVSVCSYQFPV